MWLIEKEILVEPAPLQRPETERVPKESHHSHVSTYANPPRITDEEVFGQAYNRVIHSPAALQLIQLEHTFAQAVAVEVEKRNAVLRQLQAELVAETERGLQLRAVDTADTITQLQELHVRNRDLIETQWDSCISELRRRQRRQLRDIVMNLDEQLSLADGDPQSVESRSLDSIEGSVSACLNLAQLSSGSLIPPPPSSIMTSSTDDLTHSTVPVPSSRTRKPRLTRHTLPTDPASPREDPQLQPWSESFTVQLGRQMRTTCNFRLIRADPNDLLRSICQTDSGDAGNSAAADSANDRVSENAVGERLSNALGIYSNDLNGLVILVDKRLTAYRGVKRRLAEACERSTEFHFPELSFQLSEIRQTCCRIASECSGPNSVLRRPSQRNSVTDREEDRIRSGAPLHCALSAILRTCFDYDITTLSLPLLLVQSLQDYMDATWRARRAETVFKALKGVLMELSTWRGPTVRAIQFLAPPQLSDAELASFSRIITASFLQPVPVIVPA
ncbi:unnamed protein product [Echinostoma caproni]|uniref:Uncharacterized protein n=1 Tax=Echinostoma caproni TaxID=27848 RepID=A0A183ACF1_9TREM|nr:unnamed protein product [Echinostoma caproni]